MNQILKGNISITNNIGVIREMLFSNVENVKFLCLDDEGQLPLNHPNVLGASCLLPPMEALIAEADGDEKLFDSIYFEHFNEPFIFQFTTALIISLYNGMNLVLYYPELDTNIVPKLRQHFFQRYGIWIGIMGTPDCCKYDMSCTPMWLDFIYLQNAMTPMEFLLQYPTKAKIQQNIMDKLLLDLQPYGNSLKEKCDYILSLWNKLKQKPNIKSAIHSIS